MNTLFRYNRAWGLESATVSIEDDLLAIEYDPGPSQIETPDQGEGLEVARTPLRLRLTLADLKALRDFDDGAMLAFNTRVVATDAPIEWRNLYIETLVGRRPTLEYLRKVDWNTPIRILVPARGISSIKQCRVVIQMRDAAKALVANAPIVEMASPDFLAMQFVPEITGPESVAAGGPSALYTVQLRDADGVPVAASGSIYLEATAGNLTRYRVELDASGTGSFQLLPTGLAPGEKTKIKAGFRYFPGVFDRVVSIV